MTELSVIHQNPKGPARLSFLFMMIGMPPTYQTFRFLLVLS